MNQLSVTETEPLLYLSLSTKRSASFPLNSLFVCWRNFYIAEIADSPDSEGTNHSELSATRHQTKHVILRLPLDDFTGVKRSEYDDAIMAYLAFDGRQASELNSGKHAHIEPFKAPELRQKKVHITLDMELELEKDPNIEGP